MQRWKREHIERKDPTYNQWEFQRGERERENGERGVEAILEVVITEICPNR